MATKTKECKSYTLNALRNASKSFEASEQEIREKIISTAKNLIDGGGIDPDSFAGSFRVYEMVRDRYDRAVSDYERHQERCLCEIPADLEDIF